MWIRYKGFCETAGHFLLLSQVTLQTILGPLANGVELVVGVKLYR